MSALPIITDNTALDRMDAICRGTLYPAGKFYIGFAFAVVGKSEEKVQVSEQAAPMHIRHLRQNSVLL